MSKRITYLFVILTISLTFVQSSISQDTISYELLNNGWGKMTIKSPERNYTLNQFKSKLKEQKLLRRKFDQGVSSKRLGTFLGTVGGFGLGYQLGNAMFSRSTNWTVTGVFAGITTLSIVLEVSGKNKIRKTLSQIEQLENQVEDNTLHLKGGLNGIALIYHF